MKLKATRTVHGSIMETVIAIDSFGSSEYSAEEEKELFEDYKLEIDYGKLLFSRYVEITDHKNPVIVEAPQEQDTSTEPSDEAVVLDNIVLAMPIGESHELDSEFELKYAVDVRTLEDQYKMFNNISDSACLAKCMIMTFEDVVISYIKEQFEIAKQHKDDFEEVHYYVI